MTNLYEETTEWRLEKIIHIQSIIVSDGLTDDFEDMLGDISPDDEMYKELFKKIPALKTAFTEDESPEESDILQIFWDHPEYQKGLFVQIAAQIPEYSDQNKAQGSFQSRTIY